MAKTKTVPTKRRQAWDAFKAGYKGDTMPGELDIKSTIGNAILGKDREVATDKTTDTDTTAQPEFNKGDKVTFVSDQKTSMGKVVQATVLGKSPTGDNLYSVKSDTNKNPFLIPGIRLTPLGKIKQGYNKLSKALGGGLGPTYSTKREINKLTPAMAKQSRKSNNNEPLPSTKLDQITKYIDSGNPKKLVNAGNAILKYNKKGFDMKRLAQYWVEKSQQPAYQESIEELKKLAGIK